MGDVFQILRLLWIVILRYQVTLWDENGIIENDPVNRLIAWLKEHVQEINERYFTYIFIVIAQVERPYSQNRLTMIRYGEHLLSFTKHDKRNNCFSNLTGSWSDGKLLTLLVNSVVPGLCPGGQEAHPSNGVMFLERAMDRAEAWLGVPQV